MTDAIGEQSALGLKDKKIDSTFFRPQSTTPLEAEVILRTDTNTTPFEEIGAVAGVREGSPLTVERKTVLAPVEVRVHGRALAEITTSGKYLSGDKDTWFAARDIKGGNFNDNRKDRIDNHEGYIRILGMYNESDLGYISRVTEFLNKNGLLTERIRVAWKLNQIVIGDTVENIDVWKDRVRKKAEESSPEIAKEYKDYIDNVNLVEVERDLQVAERIRDLSKCESEDTFKQILGEVFNVINVVAKVRGTSTLPNTEPPEKFNIENESDVKRYLSDWLPKQMGIYLARLRKLEMTNDFSHAQNWSLVGTLYDAQSFRGREFDYPCTDEDYKFAMKKSLAAISELFVDKKHGYIKTKYRDLELKAKASLIGEYAKEMGYGVGELDYSFFANNCDGNGNEDRINIISPSEWNLIRKEIDSSFVASKGEAIANLKTYVDIQKNVRKKQFDIFKRKMFIDPIIELKEQLTQIVRSPLKNKETLSWISPEAAMKENGFIPRETELMVTENGVKFKVLRFVDYDGKQITVPEFVRGTRVDNISQALKEFGCPLQNLEMTDLNIERLGACLLELKLPMLLAVRLAFDRLDVDLKDFVLPIKDSKRTVIIGVTSELPNKGKSLFCATMEWYKQVKAFSLDVFSGLGPKEYIEEFKKRGLTTNSYWHELSEVVRSMHSKERIKKNDRPPLGALLDKMIDELKVTGSRPEFILLEGMSIPKKDITTDAYAIVTDRGCEAYKIMDNIPAEIGIDFGMVTEFEDAGEMLEELTLLAESARSKLSDEDISKFLENKKNG